MPQVEGSVCGGVDAVVSETRGVDAEVTSASRTNQRVLLTIGRCYSL